MNPQLSYKSVQMKGEEVNCTVFYNNTNLLHKCSKQHPQSPQRLTALIQALENYGKTNKKFQIVEVKQKQGKITAQQTEKLLVQLHGQAYWQFVKQMWHEGIKKPEMYINIDTYFMKDTYISALEAARTTLIATQSILNRKNHNSFAVVRPPGHHSGLKSQPHGFSFFNNVALSANYALSTKKAKKIAIVDWDVHHGEGTQKLFYHRKDVLFISLHRFDNGKFFPHIQQSSSKNIGSGEGTGFNINICWNLEQKPKGESYKREQTCGDQQYFYAFNKIAIPLLDEFQPDLVLVSCGFDSALGDPFGNLALTSVGYTFMLQNLMKLNRNILLVLEGGYNKQVLGWASESIVRCLTNNTKQQTKDGISKLQKSEPNKIVVKGVQQCISQIGKYWEKL